MNHAIGIVIVIAAIGSASALAFAASQLVIANNVTINLGMNLKAVVIPSTTTSAPVCSATSGTYGEVGLSMSWNLNQGGSQTRYVCIHNVGTVDDLLSFNTNPAPTQLPNGLSINNSFSICSSSCSNGNSLPAGAYALATITLTASQTSPTGTFNAAFTITIA